MEDKPTRVYDGEEIRVYWYADRCVGAIKCWKSNRAVFDPARRPWVDMSAAPEDEIKKIVDSCPVQAIHWEYKDENRVREEMY